MTLTPEQLIIARAMDVVASVSPKTIKNNKSAIKNGAEGLPRTQVNPWQLIKLHDLIEEHYPGALDRIRDSW